jgi:hypothetical protein
MITFRIPKKDAGKDLANGGRIFYFEWHLIRTLKDEKELRTGQNGYLKETKAKHKGS